MTEPLVDVTGARLRRDRARRRRRLAVAGAVLAVLALVAGLVWAVWASPWLVAKQVRVSGTSLLTPEQVVSAAAVPLGTPLASLDTDAVAERVRTALPPVAAVEVARAWPDAVELAVTERVAVMVIPVAGEHMWVDGEGVAFHRTPQAPEGVMLAQGNLGDEFVLAALGRIASALPEAVRGQAVRIEASTPDSVVITLRDDRRVIWGSADQVELKARVLEPLLGVKAREYDVSAPSHPTTR